MKKLYAIVLLSLTFSSLAVANDVDYFTLMDSMEQNVSPRIESGKIQKIDIIERTIVVSGVKYFYGPESSNNPLRVRMYGVKYGAVGLLKVGMFVEVYYLQSPTYRIAKAMTQTKAREQF